MRGIWGALILAIVAIAIGQWTFIWCTVDWAEASKRARKRALERDQPTERATAESDTRGLAAADSAAAVEM